MASIYLYFRRISNILTHFLPPACLNVDSNSVLYAKSGGNGKISSLSIVALNMLLFVIGPEIASYLPRCMAGTLLLHIGIDLFLEGVYDCKCCET